MQFLFNVLAVILWPYAEEALREVSWAAWRNMLVGLGLVACWIWG
jgi:hypothetical protein